MSDPSSQRFILSAPFRTNIEMDTFSPLSEAEEESHIRKVVAALDRDEQGGSQWAAGRGSGKGDDLQYANLDDQVLPRKATPIAHLQIGGTDLERIAENALPPPCESSLRIADCSVRYYDDTIAILMCEVSLVGLREVDMVGVAPWSAEFCKSVIDWLQPFRERLEIKLQDGGAAEWRLLFSPTGRLRRFEDRNEGSREDGRTMLWVNRILVSESRPGDQAVKAWTQTDPKDADWLRLNSMSLLPCVGNSVLAGPRSGRDVGVTADAVALCTFFYLSQDLFRKRLKELHLKVARACRSGRGRRPKGGRLKRLLIKSAGALKGLRRGALSEEAVGELRDHVVVMQGEFGDCRLGLQGHLREAAHRFLKAWGYDALAVAVERKSASLETTWSLLREKRRRMYDSALQFALTVIAGFALMQFLLALLVASGGGRLRDDDVPGPIDAVSELSPDLTLNVALLLLCMLSLLVFWSRK